MIGFDDFRRAATTSNLSGIERGMDRLAFLGFDRASVDEAVNLFLHLVKRGGLTYEEAVTGAYTAGLEIGYRLGSEPSDPGASG